MASKFAGRFYVCTGGQWSTQDAATVAKCRQIIQPQRMFCTRNGMKMGYRATMTGDDHLFACFHLVQQFAQMSPRLNQIDRNHDSLTYDQ